MTPAAQKESIAVADLRVGMFVHLDMSWISHPFPLGRFRIASPEQLATIRALGVQRVRWSRELSDAPRWGTEARPVAAATPAMPVPGAGVAAPGAQAPQPATQPAAQSAAPPTPSVPTPAADTPEQAARSAHNRRLAAQRTALQVCERQYAEAAQSCRHLSGLVPHLPAEARLQAEGLSRALLGKMLGEQVLSIRVLSEAAGAKDSMHALNVTILSLLLGRSLGLAEAELLDLGVGAVLHDIGKLDLPERLRHRDDQFSASELRFHEEHVAHGVRHARRMHLTPGATLVIAQHHELADGSGHPLHLNADRMSTPVRIVSLVNRYDNLCNPHLGSKALTPHESMALLFAQDRERWDGAILTAFIRMMGVYPAGSIVQLTDERYARVVAVNASRPLKPQVLVHDSRLPGDEALVVDLESTRCLGIRRSLRPLQLPPDALRCFGPQQRTAYFFEPLECAGDDACTAAQAQP